MARSTNSILAQALAVAAENVAEINFIDPREVPIEALYERMIVGMGHERVKNVVIPRAKRIIDAKASGVKLRNRKEATAPEMTVSLVDTTKNEPARK